VNGRDSILYVPSIANAVEIGQAGRAGAYASHAAAYQAWANRWLAAVGWVPVVLTASVPQLNPVHWLSPNEIARMESSRHSGPGVPSDMVFRDYPIRDVRGYPVMPSLWSPNWDYRSQSTWDFNRRPPAGSAARPEPNELGAYLTVAGGGSGGRARRPLIRMR
jgi:hypothetical protein